MSTEHHLDANAAAGPFAEALGIDVSTAMVTCGTCGHDGPFAEPHLYVHGTGYVVRCVKCQEVTARLMRTPTEVRLDLRGARSWRLPTPT
ncbi:MAG: DUF6510 family protein [Actinoallomurus sp.]